MENFDDFGLSEQVLSNLKEKKYAAPTDVQASSIQPILDNRDVIIQSRTGSGKTAAFGLPIIENVMADVPAVQFVVLVPTRELAIQVHEEMSSLAKGTERKLCSIYGGADMGRQIKRLREGAQVVVGTPGRILDHLKRRTMSFSVVRGIVLDEADKMLSMGFLPDVQSIMNQLPKRRQVVMSSATFPYSIEMLIQDYMEDPLKIAPPSGSMTPDQISHFYCSVQANEKEAVLLALIEKEQPEFSLIFCNTKVEVKSVHYFLQKAGILAEELSSDMSQSQRERSLKRLRAGVSQHMVCTDVAARGIDIPDLSHVFCFSSSADPETYVHRTGRTGRAGRSGKAISLIATVDLAGFQGSIKTNDLSADEIQFPTEQEIAESRALHHTKKLVSIDYGKGADVRDEFNMVAEKLTPEQVGTLLPLLLEHFARPVASIAPEVTRPSSAPPRESGSGRGRESERRPRGRGRERGRGRDENREERPPRSAVRGRDREPDRSRDRDRGQGRDRDRNRGRERDEVRPSRSRPSEAPAASSSRAPIASGSATFTTVCLALGRSDGLDEMDIQNILRRQGRARMGDIGDMQMKDHESLVNIADSALNSVLEADGKHFKSFELFIGKSPVKLEPHQS